MRHESLHKLLSHVWQRSAFYKEFYSSHGIGDKDLPELTIRDLPFLSKKVLMENFDGAVTDRRLRKQELESLIEDHPDQIISLGLSPMIKCSASAVQNAAKRA